ncbi:MAG: hypothetical protein BMS9Abin36_1758 [Gammaproteobacteria bacterium]|nr:MAG: hypothetical protein BMS9Abin36_1758 [Gammaproteobacteria bacterium]
MVARLTLLSWLCLVASCFVLPAQADTWLKLTDSRKEKINEPVFQGKAQIYEAGLKQRQTVVLVHGLGGTGAGDMREIIPYLAKHFHVLTFDLPGFGQSDAGNKLYSPEKYVQFIRYVVKQRAKGSIYLLGHSMGGLIALRYAATYHNEVSRLILVSVAGVLHRVSYSKHLVALGLGQVSQLGSLGQRISGMVNHMMDKLAARRLPDELVLLTPVTRQKLFNGEASKIAGYAMIVDDVSAFIPKVQAPTLIIWGEDDNIAPLRTAKLLGFNLPNARLVVLDRSGHVPMKERPERFTALVLKHLSMSDDALRQAQRSERYALAVQMPKKTVRRGQCRDTRGRVFEGDYALLIIDNCQDVLVRNGHIGQLVIRDSSAELENLRLRSKGTALQVIRSDIQMTASHIQGQTAIEMAQSRADLAGVHVVGDKAAIKEISKAGAALPSSVIFSVSRIESPATFSYLHGYRQLLPGAAL